MNLTTKKEFLQELEKSLPSSVNKVEILTEWEIHIEEAIREETEETVIRRFGDPTDIAKAYRKNTALQKEWVVPFFLGINSLFFIVGSLLTLAYHVTDLKIADLVWNRLVEVAPVIMGGYLLFWIFLGFEIGRSYGLKGSGLLTKTVLLSMIPNLLLMMLTLYNWIPTDIFSPLLTPMFVIVCVLFTLLVYPICCLAYRLGISRSL
ncbi:HAAS signaling domain-containing protein [Bacillus sp. AK128]